MAEADELNSALEGLYEAFRSYRIPDLSRTTCFDFGPSAEELAGITKPLREIPDAVVMAMEFYEEGWDSWGTKVEVKYFLPRIMEYVAKDIERLEAGAASLFKYKLRDFSRRPDDWSAAEVAALQRFLRALMARYPDSEELAEIVRVIDVQR